MKSLFAIALISLSFNALASVNTKVDFTDTINCLVANSSGSDIIVHSVTYLVQTGVGPRVVERECNNNCQVPSGLIARFRGPSITNLVQAARCSVEYSEM